MASNTSVAIVMRTYERPIMLARAITSVCKQTFADWSLLIVNNGGQPEVVDNVVAVAKISWPHAPIHVIHLHDRLGMEEASNVALQQSDSEFFAIHDDDDTWRPTFLEKTVPALKARPDAVAVVAGITRIHELARGRTLRPQKSELFWLDESRLTFDGMIGNNTFPPIAALFRRSLLSTVGFFDSTLPVLGDWEFNLRAVTAGPFLFLPERLANYHTRTPDSDAATGNSITVGQDQHRRIKEALMTRWENDRTPDGENKGVVARRAHEEFLRREAEIAQQANQPPQFLFIRQARRVVHAVKHPTVGVRGVVRRIRSKVGR